MKFIALIVSLSILAACSIHHFEMAPVPYTITETVTCHMRPGPTHETLVLNGSKFVQVATRCKDSK
jgi:hypothetical protein